MTIVPGTQRCCGNEPRWLSLWRALGVARRELVARRTRSDSIAQAFCREIEPRERRLTASVLALTTLLIERYRHLALDDALRSLLGLWITDNLEQLSGHPFANSDAIARLKRCWRTALAPPAVADPTRPVPGARIDGLLRQHHEAADRTATTRADGNGAGTGDANGDGRDAGARTPSGSYDLDGLLLAGNDEDDAASRRLVDRLFRRLAQSLHPDREPDDDRRELKQSLMRTALKARGVRDLDTLLTLHVEHVGEPLGGVDLQALEMALVRQLEGMRRALRRLQCGDPLRRRIVERYDAQDEPTRNRLIQGHAEQLDTELDRLDRSRVALSSDDHYSTHLIAALDERRARELDRLAIDELTGAG